MKKLILLLLFISLFGISQAYSQPYVADSLVYLDSTYTIQVQKGWLYNVLVVRNASDSVTQYDSISVYQKTPAGYYAQIGVRDLSDFLDYPCIVAPSNGAVKIYLVLNPLMWDLYIVRTNVECLDHSTHFEWMAGFNMER